MIKTETELHLEALAPKRAKSPEGAESANGFRHVTPLIREESRLVFQTDPHGLGAEEFRLLRRTLSQQSATGAVLMITSPGMGDGKTLTSLNLCACLADSGLPTLLVEIDIRRPKIGRILGCTVEPPGIEDVLEERVQPSKAVHFIEELSFHAAMVARIPDDPARLMNASIVRQFLAWAREHFHWVVLDAAPVLPAADVSELLTLTDGALLVVRAQSTPRELSQRAIEVLGKRLYGVIFNEVTMDSSPYYRYLTRYCQATDARQRPTGNLL
jgi:Mrp family chromosome partitioning ATPase